MKKTAISITAAIALSACGGSDSPSLLESTPATTAAPETTTTVEVTTTTAAPAPPETRPTVPVVTEPPLRGYQPDVFLDMLRSDVSYFYYSYADDNLVDMGLLLCQELDNGASIDRLLIDFTIMASDQDYELGNHTGLYMRYVVRYLCPEHYGQIEALSS